MTREEQIKRHLAATVPAIEAAKTQPMEGRGKASDLTDGLRYCHWVPEQLRLGKSDEEILKTGIKYFVKARPDKYKETGKVWATGRAKAELHYIKTKLLKTNPNYGLGGCQSLNKKEDLKPGKKTRKVPARSLHAVFTQ